MSEEKPRLAEVVPLMTQLDQEAMELVEHMGAAPAYMAGKFGPEIAGYVMIAWDGNSNYMLSSMRTSRNPMPHALLPAFAAEVIRTEVITSNEIRSYFKERLR